MTDWKDVIAKGILGGIYAGATELVAAGSLTKETAWFVVGGALIRALIVFLTTIGDSVPKGTAVAPVKFWKRVQKAL